MRSRSPPWVGTDTRNDISEIPSLLALAWHGVFIRIQFLKHSLACLTPFSLGIPLLIQVGAANLNSLLRLLLSCGAPLRPSVELAHTRVAAGNHTIRGTVEGQVITWIIAEMTVFAHMTTFARTTHWLPGLSGSHGRTTNTPCVDNLRAWG